VDLKDFRKLTVWQKGHALALDVYGATSRFPRDEMYSLTSQMRRSAYSVPSNLAEGCCRRTDKEFGRHVQIAMGSASELEYFLLLARDLTYLSQADHTRLEKAVVEVKKMLAGLLHTLNEAS